MPHRPKSTIKNIPNDFALESAKIGEILRTAGAKQLNPRSKTMLYRQGEAANAIYFINSGKVQISVVSQQGREGTIALLSVGDFVGEASLTRLPFYLESAIAFTACEALTIDREVMLAWLRTSAPLSEYFTKFLLHRSIEVQADLVDHLFNSSEKRLARVLLLLANFGRNGKLEPIADVTQAMLAERVGTTRARISFFMNKFRRLGLIEYNGKIKVHSGLLNVVLHDSRLRGEKSKAETKNLRRTEGSK